MSDLFAEILAREMEQAGVAAQQRLPLPAHVSVSLPPEEAQLPQSLQADKLSFSGKARLLSTSMLQFAKDKGRLWRRDSGIVAGNAATGYLWKSNEGIRGHMTFSTDSGAVVDIRAGLEDKSGDDVLISVQKDGRQFVLDIEELAEAAKGPVVTPFLALENESSNSRTVDADPECSPSVFYDSRAMPVELNNHTLTKSPVTA